MTANARLRKIRTFEERRRARAEADLTRRDALIREALDAGDPVIPLAEALGVSRSHVYNLKAGARSSRYRNPK